MRDNLALLLQEALAAVARIRRREAVQDGVSFRNRLVGALQDGEQQARTNGYSAPDAKSAIFAVTAMVDETVLGSKLPAFAEWHQLPLCLELFKTNRGGEIFFENAAALLERPNSADGADVLEVYLLCLLLGFAGRYRSNDAPEIQALIQRIRDKLRQVRGPEPLLPESWRVGPEMVVTRRDVVADRLKKATIAAFLVLALVFATSKMNLLSKTTALETVTQIQQGQ